MFQKLCQMYSPKEIEIYGTAVPFSAIMGLKILELAQLVNFGDAQ